MKFTSAFVTLVFIATGVTARPSRLAERVAARQRNSLPKIAGSESTALKVDGNTNTTHPTEFSSNWSGAVITSPPAGQTFNHVVGTFTVPTPSGTGSASAWVGIDGDTAGNSILQSGVDFTVSGGRVSFDSWFEWFPNFATDFTNFPVEAGNSIQVTISATTSTTGTVTLDNLSTGHSVSESLRAPSSSAALAGQNAEWIVEDFEENGSMVTLTDFGTVTFTGASASTAQQSVPISGATIIDMEQNGKVLTSVSVSGTSVSVSHL